MMMGMDAFIVADAAVKPRRTTDVTPSKAAAKFKVALYTIPLLLLHLLRARGEARSRARGS